MSYLVLARKYRPQNFDSVVAQEHVTRTLRNALKRDRTASGYLFCGPRGTGKTTVARILAKSLNCVKGPTEMPCDECPACLEITSGSSLDVLEIDAASNTGVDDIRTLRENVRYLPTAGKKRIYIIDEIHRLSGSAFDALLKTLEEPPPHVIFIFATTEPLKIPETILSRTQRFDFRRVSTDDLLRHLRKIADSEQIDIDDAALKILARKADGSVRDSLSLLDQIAAFSGERIVEEDVVNALGLVDRKFLFDFVEAVAAKDRRKALLATKILFDSGVDSGDFIGELLDHLRKLMILAADSGGAGLLDLGPSEKDEYSKQATYFSVGDILRLIKLVGDLAGDLKSGLDERLVIETGAVRMADMEATVRFEEILAHMKNPPASTGATPSDTTAPAANPGPSGDPDFFGGSPATGRTKPTEIKKAAEPAPEPDSPVADQSLNMPQIVNGWENFLNSLRRLSPMLAPQMRMAELRSVKDNVLQMFFSASGEASLQLVTTAEKLAIINRALREHYGANLSARFQIDHDKKDITTDSDKATEQKVDPAQLIKQSPRLKSLMEKVDGEIIGIKKAE